MALRFKPPTEKQQVQDSTHQTDRTGEGARGEHPRSGEGTRRSRSGDGRWVKVYLLRGQQPSPVQVHLGITGGSYTEVVEGAIEEGQQIILALSDGAKTTNRSSVSNPFGMRGFGGH